MATYGNCVAERALFSFGVNEQTMSLDHIGTATTEFFPDYNII